jgi:hypothetical protein|eukprot:7376536-Prymnesium_polylepis.3
MVRPSFGRGMWRWLSLASIGHLVLSPRTFISRANNKQFQHMPIMLIFTKVCCPEPMPIAQYLPTTRVLLCCLASLFQLDLFEATYDEERFREVFPRFTGPKNTGQNAAVRFLVKEFKSRLELRPQSSQVLTYTLDTTDPNDFEVRACSCRTIQRSITAVATGVPRSFVPLTGYAARVAGACCTAQC